MISLKELNLKIAVFGDGFPLSKGDNVLSFNGGITRVEIIPRWVSL